MILSLVSMRKASIISLMIVFEPFGILELLFSSLALECKEDTRQARITGGRNSASLLNFCFTDDVLLEEAEVSTCSCCCCFGDDGIGEMIQSRAGYETGIWPSDVNDGKLGLMESVFCEDMCCIP